MKMCNGVVVDSLCLSGVFGNGLGQNAVGYHRRSRSGDPNQPGRATISREKETKTQKSFARVPLHPLPLYFSHIICGGRPVNKHVRHPELKADCKIPPPVKRTIRL